MTKVNAGSLLSPPMHTANVRLLTDRGGHMFKRIADYLKAHEEAEAAQKKAADEAFKKAKQTAFGVLAAIVIFFSYKSYAAHQRQLADDEARTRAATASMIARRERIAAQAEKRKEAEAAKLAEPAAEPKPRRAPRPYDADRRDRDGCAWRTMPNGAKVPFC